MADELGERMLWRVTLLDVLQGRVMRQHAWEAFEATLDTERLGAPRAVVDRCLDQAAHWEWIAGITERGQVAWGARVNRCGSAEREET